MCAAIQPATHPFDVFSGVQLPSWGRYRQRLDDEDVGSIPDAIAREFAKPEILETIQPGQRVVLTAGSRGIDRIAEVLKAAVDQVRLLGAEPFIIPAMGSHGGATAEGQLALIAHYGITEEAMGCPIRASMETVHLGELADGVPVCIDRIAHDEADVVIPVGRVKPHTDFRGPVESGLMKMIAIGLGKQNGANWFHSQGIGIFGDLIPRVAEFTLSKVNIPFGIALVENGLGKMSIIEAVPAARIREREAELLEIAKAKLAKLPQVPAVDVLIVDKIGKDISGDGADPNVINRDVAGTIDFTNAFPKVQRYVVRNLTTDTEGNATGIGMFDFALRGLVNQIDPIPTYMNMITAKSPSGARVPITVDTDQQAMRLAVSSALKISPSGAKMMRILSTKSLEYVLVSSTLAADLANLDNLEAVGQDEAMTFDLDGMFTLDVYP